MASTGRSESPVQSSTFRHSAWTLHDSREEGQPREAELVSSTWRLEKFGKFMKIAPKLEEYVSNAGFTSITEKSYPFASSMPLACQV